MKQLKTVFAYEFTGYFKRRSYVILTVVLMVAVAVVLSFPRFMGGADTTEGGDGAAGGAEMTLVPLVYKGGDAAAEAEALNALGGETAYAFAPYDGDAEALRAAVESGEVETGVVLTGPLSYQRFVDNLNLYDSFDSVFSELLVARYQAESMSALGVPTAEIGELLGAQVEQETITVGEGKDQAQNFIYTYVLIFLLYFAILMYGQFVASSVATEKSTRAMELLITSTKPNNLMFGKVLGSGFAGLLQLVLILGTAFLFYNLNADLYADNYIVQSLFGIQLDILLYMFLFFILGFFIYAFIYAALGSLVSRMEDLSTAIMPVTYIFIAAFLIVMLSMSTGNVDSPLMVFCSFFPLTSPMAMFTRIAMGDVAGWQVLVSVVILIAATVGMGILSAAIYRLGVLLYGNAPKPTEIVRMLRAHRQQKTAN